MTWVLFDNIRVRLRTWWRRPTVQWMSTDWLGAQYRKRGTND